MEGKGRGEVRDEAGEVSGVVMLYHAVRDIMQ